MERRFKHIETCGVLPDGRKIRQNTSYPGEGATYEEYLEKDRQLIRAFGSRNCFTRGEYALPHPERITHGSQRTPVTRSRTDQGHDLTQGE